jgi:hypothetical protein
MVSYITNPFRYLQRPVLVGSAKVREIFYFASFRAKNFLMFLSATCGGGFQLKRAAKVRSFFDFQNSVEKFSKFLVSFCQFNQFQLS